MRLKLASAIIICALWPGFLQGQALQAQLHAGAALPSGRQFRPGLETGFGAVLSLASRLAAVLEYDRWQSRVKGSPVGFLDGDFTATPLSLSLRYQLLSRAGFIWYASAGGCHLSNRFLMDHLVTIPEIKINQAVKNTAGVCLGSGTERRISARVAIFLEAAYLLARGRGVTTITDMNQGLTREEFGFSLNSFHLRAGLRLIL